MKTRLGRNVEIVMAVYVAIGIAIVHKTFEVYGLIFSGSCGLLTLAVMMLDEQNGPKFREYDSWGWSKSASKGVIITVIISGVGGIPFWQKWIYGYLGQHEIPVMPFWPLAVLLALGGMMGVAIYFRGYLKPIESEIMNIEMLKLEHNEWFGIFQAAGILLGVSFVATGFSYITGLLGETQLLPLTELLYLVYLAVGYVVWGLRPLHGRGKEIRDHINKLRQVEGSSKQVAAKNET
jgi:hypothetical protein